MRTAEWHACEQPPESMKSGLVHIAELVVCDEDDIQGSIDFYVHVSGQFVLSCRPIGGGWDWSIAYLDRRAETDWTQFIKTYGNGER